MKAPHTGSGEGDTRGKAEPMEFDYTCGWCGAPCVVWGEPSGFWGTKYQLPDEWDCWHCGGINDS